MNSPSRAEVVAAEVRAEMARQNLSIAQLSAATGIPLSTLRRRLTAHSSLTVDELSTVANALGVPPVDLMQKPVRAVA